MVRTIVPYDQLMTPVWIEQNAEITGPHTVTSSYYEISSTTGARYQRALRVQLLPPGLSMNISDTFTITITFALDTEIAQTSDHDPVFGISDMKSFVGFITFDIQNFPNYAPCVYLDGDVGSSGLANAVFGNGPKTNSKRYSSEVKMHIRPTEKWGSCHTEQEDGMTLVTSYQRSLDPANGLFLEAYRHDAKEKYHIKYIEVDLQWD